MSQQILIVDDDPIQRRLYAEILGSMGFRAESADGGRIALDLYKGQMSRVARRLGIGRSTLYRKVREIGLNAGDEPAEQEAAGA